MPLSEKFEEALVFVARLHRDHIRKGTAREGVPPTPYVSHLLGVASFVLEAGGDEDEAIAALCHDAIEDQPRDGATERELLERFGGRVLGIVKACTTRKPPQSMPAEEKRDFRRRVRAEYIEHIRQNTDRSVLLVTAADKLHNARAILGDLKEQGDAVWARFHGTREETVQYYRDALKALEEARANARLVGELRIVVGDIERLVAR